MKDLLDHLGQPFASVIEDRYPRVKLHRTLGHARAAVRLRDRYVRNPETARYEARMRGGVVYEHVGGEWVERERVEPGAKP